MFDERGVHGQCWQCNEYKHGNPNAYEEFMFNTYGQEVIDELRANRNETIKYTIDEYEDFKEFYDRKTEELLKFPHLAKLLLPVNLDHPLPF